MPAVTPFNPIPATWTPWTQISQWVEVGENITLPAGKIFLSGRDEYTVQETLDKGVTHINKYHLDFNTNPSETAALIAAGKTYNAVPKNNEIFNMPGNLPAGPDEWRTAPNGTRYNAMFWPNGPLNQADSISKARQSDNNYPLWIGETCENTPWISLEDPMWGWFYPEFKASMVARHGADKVRICHNYYLPASLPWWTLGFDSQANHVSKIARPYNQWESTPYSPGRTLSATNLIVDGIYIGAPDANRRNVLRSIYKMMIFKKMGFYAGIFLFSVHEWRPNNHLSTEYPSSKFPSVNGTFYRQEKVPLDLNDIMSYAFWAYEFGDMYGQWGAGGRNTSYKWNGNWPNNDLFYPTGSSSPTAQEQAGQGGNFKATGFPYYAYDGDGQKVRYSNAGGSDASYFGMRMWDKTFGQILRNANYSGKFCKYRINGGAWVTPGTSYAQPVVDTYFGTNTGIAYSALNTAQNKLALAFYQVETDNTARTVEIEHPTNPAITYTFTIAGNATKAVLINL